MGHGIDPQSAPWGSGRRRKHGASIVVSDLSELLEDQ